MRYEARELNYNEVQSQLPRDPLPGHCVLPRAHPGRFLKIMLKPIHMVMRRHLRNRGKGGLVKHLWRYLAFKMWLGMLKPRRIDDLFEVGHPDEDNYVANLLHRKLFYKMQRNCNVDITDLIEACNEGWVQWWEQGDAVAIDEAVAPHKGRRTGGIIQYIPRKPHSTGIKLYVLCDSVSGYVLQVYLYTGKKGQLRRSSPKVAGKFTGPEIVNHFCSSLQPDVVVVCDSFFGSHRLAQVLACREQPFLFLVKRDQLGVQEGGALLSEGEHCITTNADAGYALHVYKNPKVGGKAACVVPLMANCAPEEQYTVSESGKPVPGVIQAYRDLAGGVDTANQLALQWRERGRFRKWSNSVRAFMLRYAATNAYLAARYTKSIHHDCSMYDFQLLALEHMFPRESAPDHTPSKRTSRGRCVVCGQRTYWWCPTCNVPLHVQGQCWTAHHC